MPQSEVLRPFTADEWGRTVREAHALAREYRLSLAGVQLFMCGPAGYRSLFAGEVAPRLRREQSGYVVHGHYMSATLWTVEGPAERENTVVGARKHFAGQLRQAASFGATGVISHLPTLAPRAVAQVVEDVVRRARTGARMWLETSAQMPGRGYGYANAGELRELAAALDDRGVLRGAAGICLDTAHLWSQGNACVQTYEGFEELLRPAREALDYPLPFMAHLNDCSLPLGAGRDVHISVGFGEIWRDRRERLAESGVMAVLDLARELGGLAVLERKGPVQLVDDYLALAELSF